MGHGSLARNHLLARASLNDYLTVLSLRHCFMLYKIYSWLSVLRFAYIYTEFALLLDTFVYETRLVYNLIYGKCLRVLCVPNGFWIIPGM